MTNMYPYQWLILLLFMILKCDCQSFAENSQLKRQHRIEFPTSEEPQFNLQVKTSFDYDPSAVSILDEPYNPTISNKISHDVFQLAQEMLTRLNSKFKTKAQIFSPISIASAFTLLLLGSNGQTYKELERIFGLNYDNTLSAQAYQFYKEFGLLVKDLTADAGTTSRSRPQPPWKSMYRPEIRLNNVKKSGLSNPSDYHHVRIANGIFVENGFSLRRDYENVVKNVFNAEISPLEFSRNPTRAKNYINEWVNKNTHGKIKEIISDQIAPETNVIVVNALYFKALWEKEFLDSSTRPSEFYPNGINASPIQVDMMANAGVFPYYDAKEYGCEIIGLPYKGNVSTMYIIQPYNSSAQKLLKFQATLSADKIDNMISKMTKKTAIMLIPKMHLTNDVNLKDCLTEFGINSIFDPRKSDLSLMADGSFQSNTNNQNLARVPLYYTQTQGAPLVFSPIGNVRNQSNLLRANRRKRGVTYKVESSFRREVEPLRLKDFVLNKRITKHNPGKKLSRSRRQVDTTSPLISIKNLDSLRNSAGLRNPNLFVEEVVHKVDLVVNEKGTEGGAATIAYIRRSGTDVTFVAGTPFIILVRHDATGLPLFYGTVFEP